MALTTIEGVYENGKVKLAERPEGIERAKVMVTFLPEATISPTRQERKSKAKDVSDTTLPAANDRYPQTLREEYKALIQQKLRRSLTAEGAARLETVRNEINQLDRQAETWSAWENRAREMEQELADVRRELEALPDA